MDNIGNTFSAKSISDFLKNQGRKLSVETIYNYLKALENAFIISKVQRYDIKGKNILETQEKYYLSDLGFRHAKLGYQSNDISGYLENIVFLELLRRKYKVNIGKQGNKEIDFIANLRDENLYLEEIKKYMNKPIIKVITGMRRSGKSMILKLIQEELENVGIIKENIIYMNFESLIYIDIKDFETLYKHIIEKTFNKKGKIYILLDEIQEVKGWEKAINSFLVDLDIDIYITGSNANLLSSELATYIAGRYVEIKIFD